MKKITFLCFIFSLAYSSTGLADGISPEKKVLIDELLQLSGATKMGEMFSGVFVQQMTTALKAAKPDINPKAFEIIKEEVNQLIHEEIVDKNALNNLAYPIYDKSFTLSDLEGVIAFYKSKVGQKLLAKMPTITQESMASGQAWGQSLVPKLQKRVLTCLQTEGITIK